MRTQRQSISIKQPDTAVFVLRACKCEVRKADPKRVHNEFNEFRGTDPRVTDEPFQLTAQQWCRWFKHHQLPMLQLSGNYSGHLQTSEHDTVQL